MDILFRLMMVVALISSEGKGFLLTRTYLIKSSKKVYVNAVMSVYNNSHDTLYYPITNAHRVSCDYVLVDLQAVCYNLKKDKIFYLEYDDRWSGPLFYDSLLTVLPSSHFNIVYKMCLGDQYKAFTIEYRAEEKFLISNEGKSLFESQNRSEFFFFDLNNERYIRKFEARELSRRRSWIREDDC